MTFGMTLTEHTAMAASASMFYTAIDYENEPNMKVAASNVMVSAWPLHSGKPQGAWHELVLKERDNDHKIKFDLCK